MILIYRIIWVETHEEEGIKLLTRFRKFMNTLFSINNSFPALKAYNCMQFHVKKETILKLT